jgi:MoxR-like ATPase
LIDEVDKSDAEFEAFLLEVLSDFQISVPEIGTLKAKHIPIVVLTSNNSREMSDALKRRCLHLYLDFPDAQRELEIIKLKVPGVADQLANEVVQLLQRGSDVRVLPQHVASGRGAHHAGGREQRRRSTELPRQS